MITFPTADPNSAQEGLARILAFTEDYAMDAKFRARVLENPHDVLRRNGLTLPPSLEIAFVENTDEVYHFVMPTDPNIPLDDEDLSVVAGGKTASTGGTAGTASTFSTYVCTLGCAACASSVGSAGSTG